MEQIRRNFENFIDKVAAAAEQNNAVENGDYIGDNGLLYCGKCNTPKQCEVEAFGKKRNVYCICKCKAEKLEATRAVDMVANSIREFGFKVPIVVDKDNVIVAGHTRLKAPEKLGIKKVPVIVADDLDEEQIKAFRLADNKTAELAEWDFAKLEEELKEIEMEMSQFGFTSFEDVDWAGVEDLNDNNYDPPEKEMLECPNCHHVDTANRFKKVEGSADE